MTKKHFNALTQEDFNRRLYDKTEGKVVTRCIYRNNRTKMLFTNIDCGHTFISTSSHVLEGHTCKVCGYIRVGKKLRKSHEKYCQEVYEIWGNEYTILSQYEKDSTKLLVRHNTCGNTYYKLAGSLLQKYGCKFCNESKGEKEITNFLIKNNISFEREYRDSRCKRKLPLPFDFAIFKDNKLVYLIEYDGELHYKPGRWSNADKKLSNIKDTEVIKNTFARDYNITLIRIPYWKFHNIHDLLSKALL